MMAKLLHAQGKSIEEIAKAISITEDQVKALLGIS
jgi:DNA-binding CsgD family transcriptional regulator